MEHGISAADCVMAGRDPAIHERLALLGCFLDGRLKGGHDNTGRRIRSGSPRRTFGRKGSSR